MFKRIGIALLSFMLFMIIGQVGIYAADKNNVKDFLNSLKESEIQELQDNIGKVRNDSNLDAVIVITDNTEGKSSKAFSDDYYDSNGYGVGSDHSGLLMLINMSEREVWISTTGKAMDIFSDSRISEMVNHVTGPLSNGKYYDACNTFINDVKSYASMGVPKEQYGADSQNVTRTPYNSKPGVTTPYKGEKRSYLSKATDLMKSFIIYIIALIAAVAATVIASISSKGRETINNQTYEEKGSFALAGSSDDFINETVTSVKIQRNSGGGSGSSTHTGSSGTTHGGGGGRF